MFSALREFYNSIRLYRDWSFGRHAPARQDQTADMPTDWLNESCDNLAAVLNELAFQPPIKANLLEALQALLPNVTDIQLRLSGGRVQRYLKENERMIPSSHLSDGTLRYLALLAIFLNPKQGGVICLEEPELGMHPDILPTIAKLMIDASERSQVIVTTHSDILVDALADDPERIIICEKEAKATTMRRLEAEKLRPWLEEYSLGALWTRGQLGGNRW